MSKLRFTGRRDFGRTTYVVWKDGEKLGEVSRASRVERWIAFALDGTTCVSALRRDAGRWLEEKAES